MPAHRQLLEIVEAADRAGFVFGPRQGGEEQGGKDGDNGNDDEQFDESKCTTQASRAGTGKYPEPVRPAGRRRYTRIHNFGDSPGTPEMYPNFISVPDYSTPKRFARLPRASRPAKRPAPHP